MSFKVFRASASSFETLFLSNHRAKLHDRRGDRSATILGHRPRPLLSHQRPRGGKVCGRRKGRIPVETASNGGVLLECGRLAREHGGGRKD